MRDYNDRYDDFDDDNLCDSSCYNSRAYMIKLQQGVEILC